MARVFEQRPDTGTVRRRRKDFPPCPSWKALGRQKKTSHKERWHKSTAATSCFPCGMDLAPICRQVAGRSPGQFPRASQH